MGNILDIYGLYIPRSGLKMLGFGKGLTKCVNQWDLPSRGGLASQRRMENLPETRGRLTPGKLMSELTWLRVGGPAEVLFQPEDADDLADFLAALPLDIPVFPMGVGSNLIVRDGGLTGVVIRLGRAFSGIEIDGDEVIAGAAALDARVANAAAEAGLDLTFLRTIPGSIGGAVKMNAGCYGAYIADICASVHMILRDGTRVTLPGDTLGFAYRSSQLPEGVVVSARFKSVGRATPEELKAKMAEQIAKRDASQPTKERTAGSTFRNPAGFSSTGQADDVHDLKAWKLIDEAGMRGAVRGGAQMSPMHSNFLVNTGGATAAELEGLGEEVRQKVYERTGIELQWEIMRIGEAPDA